MPTHGVRIQECLMPIGGCRLAMRMTRAHLRQTESAHGDREALHAARLGASSSGACADQEGRARFALDPAAADARFYARFTRERICCERSRKDLTFWRCHSITIGLSPTRPITSCGISSKDQPRGAPRLRLSSTLIGINTLTPKRIELCAGENFIYVGCMSARSSNGSTATISMVFIPGGRYSCSRVLGYACLGLNS